LKRLKAIRNRKAADGGEIDVALTKCGATS
jgi:hypothetical protein